MVNSSSKFCSFLVRILIQKDNTDNKDFKKEFYTKETKGLWIWAFFSFQFYQNVQFSFNFESSVKLSFQQNSWGEFSFSYLTWYNFICRLSFNFTFISWEACLKYLLAVQEVSDKTFLLAILSCLYSLVPKFVLRVPIVVLAFWCHIV